tara:strand:- start:1095 stop:1268 length:174 start_codon:yes stop_codon:yes gene_type:complete
MTFMLWAPGCDGIYGSVERANPLELAQYTIDLSASLEGTGIEIESFIITPLKQQESD